MFLPKDKELRGVKQEARKDHFLSNTCLDSKVIKLLDFLCLTLF